MEEQQSKKKQHELFWRVIWGFVSTIIATGIVALAFFPNMIFFFLMALSLFALVGAWEFFKLAEAKGFAPLSKIGMGACVLLIFLSYASINSDNVYQGFTWSGLLLLLCVCLARYFRQSPQPLINIALTLFGVVYVVAPLALMISILHFPQHTISPSGGMWLAYLLVVTKMTDVGGYIVGKKWGKLPLAPKLSPKKTKEGALAGAVASVAASIAFCFLSQYFQLENFNISFLGSIFLGCSIAFFAMLGDLGESLLKRDANVKDSNQLPGLGGFLDLLDSLVFTTPALYIFLVLRGAL
jgi:phosphatidate cytidylyltransferase